MTFAELISSQLCDLISAQECFRFGKVWGLAEQVEKDGRLFPVYNEKGRGKDIIPDSRLPLQVYFRTLESERLLDSEGFGDIEHRNTLRMLIVAVGDLRTLDGCLNSQHAIVDTLADLIPETMTLTNWYGVQTGSVRKFTNKAEVLTREYRGIDWPPNILDLVAVAIEVEFEGVECDIVCTPDECELQTLVVTWDSSIQGDLYYNTEQNCINFNLGGNSVIDVLELANLDIRICSVSYTANNISIFNNSNDCELEISAILTEGNNSIGNGSYLPCTLCNATGEQVVLINPSDATGNAWTNGGHTGAITNCQGIQQNFGATPAVWFRVQWDCENCIWINEEGDRGYISGEISITINYKLC